ncbi:MAG: NAD(P)/FAD-dependent oxidoreductase [bacterium]|nr:NAD(P)/FAD-dependent oxidoreductase [bacterium]
MGAGTAGPAAAAFLMRNGNAVSLFDQATPLRPVGAGLLLQPTGLAVLRELGIADRMLRLGHRIDQLSGWNREGVAVLDLAYSEIGESYFGLAVNRGALFETLMSAVTREGVDVHAGVRMVRSERVGAGRILIAEDGRRFGPFDLVIAADGARSTMRASLGIPAHLRPYAWGAMWCVVPRLDDLCDHTLVQHYEGTGKMLGFLPIGRVTEGAAESVAIFWSIPTERRQAFLAAGRDAWLREASRLCPRAEAMLSAVRSTDEFLFAAYADVHAPKPWIGDVAAIGDAAHATSPQLGQGANLALIDARTLADAIRQCDSIESAAAEYTTARKDHVRFYRWTSALLTPWFQSEAESLGVIRDVAFPIARQVPWVRRQMALSLIGVKTGLFSELTQSTFKP